MKKFFSLVLSLAMLFTLAACGDTTEDTATETVTAPAEVVEVEEAHTISEFPVYGCRYYPSTGNIITSDGEAFGVCDPDIRNFDEGDPYEGMPVVIAVEGDPDKVESWVILGVVYDRMTAIYDELEAAAEKMDGYTVSRDGNIITIDKE